MLKVMGQYEGGDMKYWILFKRYEPMVNVDCVDCKFETQTDELRLTKLIRNRAIDMGNKRFNR